MAKQLNVDLNFKANTEQAKKAINDLNAALQKVARMPGSAEVFFDDASIINASKAALELQQHLQSAVNVNTGKLDLSRFSTSLKTSGKQLNDYYDKLLACGEEGQTAFLKLAQSIVTAEAPVTRINNKLAEMGTVLKNTIKWQISSSVLHGFMGTLQSAYGYAQDLNQSLNSIRIVSGESAEQMADFAKQANKAAKELSSTTLAYTDASLIFYQMGLDRDEVTERTDAVIKMSNVTGEAVEDVSSYMTAIWNNFEGTYKNLEQYADVLTALGAATASSTEEIAGGLEQFASIAQTVGLSYEYATSALATVVATTRQSESIVGTAFKTIFSRLQGLSLGETLDDGVDLNKYSKALEAVGVEILDTTGELKDLDLILDDLADQWDILSSAQKAALAQTVAGTRQYQQLIALMDNWDFMEENLTTAENAKGALQEQADIYAESWEAARKRVKTASQAIYSDLVDDNFFIGLTDSFAKLLTVIEKVINSLGGVKGVLSGIGGIFLSLYASKMPEAIDNLKANFWVLTGQAKKAMLQVQNKTEEYLKTVQSSSKDLAFKTQAEGLAKVDAMQQKLVLNSHNMSEQEQNAYKLVIQNVQAMYQEAEAAARVVQALQEKAKLEKESAVKATVKNAKQTMSDYLGAKTRQDVLQTKVGNMSPNDPNYLKANWDLDDAKLETAELKTQVLEIFKIIGADLNEIDSLSGEKIKNFSKQLEGAARNIAEELEKLHQKWEEVQSISVDGDSKVENWRDEAQKIQNNSEQLDNLKKKMKDYLKTVMGKGINVKDKDVISGLSNEIDGLDTSKLDDFLNRLKSAFSLKDTLDSLNSEIEQTEDSVEGIGGTNTFSGYEQSIDEAAEANIRLKNSIDNVHQSADEVPPSTFEASVAWTEFAAAAMSAYTTLNSVKNLVSAWKEVTEENGSALEVFSAILSVAMSAVAAYGTVQRLATTLSTKDTIMKGAQTLATKLHTLATRSATTATQGQAAANITLQATMSPILVITLAIIAALAVLVVAVAGITALIKAATVAMDDSRKAQQRAQESVEQLTEKCTELKTSYEELKTAIEDYQDAYNAFQELEKGAEGYAEALKEANQAAENLINTYDLYGKWFYDSNGAIQFDEGVLEQIEKEKQDELSYTELQLNAANSVLNKRNEEAYRKSVNKDNDIDLENRTFELIKNATEEEILAAKDRVSTGKKRALISEEKDTNEEKETIPLNNLTAQDILDLHQSVAQEEADKHFQNSIYGEGARGQEVSDSPLLSFVENLDEEHLDLAVSLLGEEFDTVRESLSGFAQQTDYYTQAIAKNYAEIQGKYSEDTVAQNAYANLLSQQEDFKTAVEGISSSVEQATYNRSVKTLLSDFEGDQYSYGESLSDKELALAYAKYIEGWSEEALKNANYDNHIGSGTLSYDGEEDLSFTKNDQYMREELTKYLLSQQLADSGSTAYNTTDTTTLDANMSEISEASQAVSDTIYGALQNWQAGEAISLDYSLISPEEAEAAKQVIENLSKEGGQSYVEALTAAIENYDPQQYWDRVEEEQAANIDQQVEDNELDADVIATQTALIQDSTEALEDNANAAKQLAVNNTRMNKGMETLIENWEDWKEVLESGDKTSAEYAETITDLKDTVGDLVGLSEDMSKSLSNAFFDSAENLALLEKAANADEEAITDLGIAASKDLVSNLSVSEDILQSFADGAKSIEIGEDTYTSLDGLTQHFESCRNDVLSFLDDISNAELQVGQNLAEILDDGDIQQFADNLNEMAKITNMSVADMQGVLNSLGVEGNVTSEWVDETVKVPQYHTQRTNQKDEDGDGVIDSWDETTVQTGEVPMEGGRYVASLSYDGSTPKSSINYVGHGKASSANKTSASKKSSGGSSSKSKKDTKKYSDEFDRYHDIKEAIDEVSDAVSDLGREQKHLFGNELANNLRKQNVLLEQQADDYRILAGMQKEEQQELQASLSQNGMVFDQQTGLMMNYAEVTAAALAELNAAITSYNASAQEEADKLVLEAAEEKYELFKTTLERYDSLVDEIRETENNLDDLYYQEVSNTLSSWEAEIEIKLDLSEAKRTWEEFIDEISNDFTSVYKDISKNMSSLINQASTYIGDNGTLTTDLQNVLHAQEFIRQAQGISYNSDGFKDLAKAYGYASISEAQDKLKEYNEALQSDASDLYGLYESTWDTYIEGIDQAIEKFDDLVEQYDRINDDLEHQAQLIELLYGEQAYDYLNQLYTAESENLLGKMSSLAQQAKFYQQQYENAVGAYGEDSEAADKFKEVWLDALDELNSTEEEYIESIQNKALNAIDEIFDDLDSRLTGGSSMSWLSEQWEDATSAADGYYDEVERIYQLESLERKFDNAINEASTLKSQQALKTILDEQLTSLENKTTLSEYDIELAEKRLAVYQAQIALEDAQNNKTSMKLTRNEAGNWTYQYVADEGDVQGKQEALMQAQNEYYEFTKTSWEDLTNTIIEDTQTAMDRIKELEEESISATTERQAEIAEQIEYLREYYWGAEGVITKEITEHAEYENNLNQATAETLWGLYDIDTENFTLMTETEQGLITQLKDYGVNSFQTLYDSIAQNYDNIQNKCDEVNTESLNTWTTTAAEMCRVWASDDGDSVITAVTSALFACDQAIVDYASLVQQGCAAAQQNFANVSEQIYQDQLATYALEGQTEQLVQSTVDSLTTYAQYLAQIQSMWNGVADSIMNATQAAIAYLSVQGIQTSVNTVKSQSFNGLKITTPNGQSSTNKTTTDSSGIMVTKNTSSESVGKKTSGVSPYSGGGGTPIEGREKYTLFDTGGYTGNWSEDGGKLAILHKKELVLNAADTENILSAVKTIRSIAGVSDSIIQSIASGIAKMMYGMSGLSAVSSGSEYSNKANENNVFNITAEFPNAENVNEIREAIMSLPTLASQYLSKNLK